ncbi:hypothetical protein FI667_g5841, partial [Globisporangium splendens]
MAQGFSGGFFLPAQRSVHCKGGFFATDGAVPQRLQQRLQGEISKVAAAATFYESTSNSSGNQYASTATSHNARRHSSRRMDMDDNDDDPPERPARRQQAGPRCEEKSLPGTKESFSESQGGHDECQQTFLTWREELTDIFEWKWQATSSAPAIVFAHGSLHDETVKPHSDLPQSASRKPSSAASNQQQRSLLTTSNNSKSSTATDASEPRATPETKNLNSPRQRLQVAEMVMRKLYRKNLQTEEVAAKLKEENAQLAKRIQQLEHSATVNAHASTTNAKPEIGKFGGAGNQHEEDNIPPIVNPPTLESVNRIDQQQLEHLRHLAAEQDKTIACLKIRIEELSNQLEAVKQQPEGASQGGTGGRTENGKGGKATPRQLVNRLQSKLQHVLSEFERQKTNYIKVKQDFQHLLGLKTKRLVGNPAQLNTSARELLQLMEKNLAQIEREHSQNLSVYDSKLYEVEQQTCESYVQKKMMEEEIQRIAQDVQRRDDVDVQIEQCMVGVFKRLRQVELENVLLKATTASTSAAAAINDRQ